MEGAIIAIDSCVASGGLVYVAGGGGGGGGYSAANLAAANVRAPHVFHFPPDCTKKAGNDRIAPHLLAPFRPLHDISDWLWLQLRYQCPP